MDDNDIIKDQTNKYHLGAFWWQQKPLSHAEAMEVIRHKCRKMSLRSKIVLLLTAALLAFGLASVAISYQLYIYAAVDQHKRLGDGLANLLSYEIDGDRINDYLAGGESTDGYLAVKARLAQIKLSSPDIRYLYVYKITPGGCQVVFDIDAVDDPGDPLGMIVPLDPAMAQYEDLLLAGRRVPAILDQQLYTQYTPIYDSRGICQAYAAVDISMYDIEEQAHVYLMRTGSIFSLLFLVILLFGLQFAKYNLIMPINTLAHTVGKFVYNDEEGMERSLAKIRELGICTGDEVENLYRAYMKTAADSVQHIKDVREKSEIINHMQKTLIITIADLVERRDENTGQHIKKTAAYVRIILEEMRRQGIYKEMLTDEFIEDVVMSAPLHDVGKITIPDSILNKPGKLTPEEFALMQCHTTAGGRIIARIIGSVPETDYLYEAMNLATYHHERWDGTGYPMGLMGKDIPLSARVMAVADMFDALVSKRVYKPGFPYDKAVKIMQEECGTHFDPKIIKAFMTVKEEIIQVAKHFNEMEDLDAVR